MSVNLSSLTPITTAATALSGLVLVSPQSVVGYQPQNPTSDSLFNSLSQPPSLVFAYEGDQEVNLESDITDHWVEDNIAREDQIALHPETYTTRGFIGELTDVVPDLLKPLKILADKLVFVDGYVPEISETAILAYNEAFFLYQTGASVVNSAISSLTSLANLIDGGDDNAVINSFGLQGFNPATGKTNGVQNKQQAAFQQLYGYWRARYLFTIQTPWAVFQNMAIQKIRSIQSAETNTVSEFEVTFKMIRTASTRTITTFTEASLFQGRGKDQASGQVNNGTNQPADDGTTQSGNIANITGPQ